MAFMYTDALRNDVHFLMASSLYHPDTVERSLRHDGSGENLALRILTETGICVRIAHG